MNSNDWTSDEARQVVALGVAPLAVCAATALIGSLAANPAESLLMFVALIPAAYLTLFLAVLPSLWMLRRSGQESLWSFSAVCGLSAVLPWLAVYVAFFSSPDADTGKFGGATAQIAAWLCIPALITAIAAAAVYRLQKARPSR